MDWKEYPRNPRVSTLPVRAPETGERARDLPELAPYPRAGGHPQSRRQPEELVPNHALLETQTVLPSRRRRWRGTHPAEMRPTLLFIRNFWQYRRVHQYLVVLLAKDPQLRPRQRDQAHTSVLRTIENKSRERGCSQRLPEVHNRFAHPRVIWKRSCPTHAPHCAGTVVGELQWWSTLGPKERVVVVVVVARRSTLPCSQLS